MKSKPVGVGGLFGRNIRSQFLDVTRQRYETMKGRLERKGYDKVPFTLDEFRADIRGVMGGNEDGAVICRYCHRPMSIEGTTADHAIPLSRGGGPELSNIDYPCIEDNQRKGSLTPDEYNALLELLDKMNPWARQDVLSRLQKAVQLAASVRFNSGVVTDLKKSGAWAAAQAKRKAAKEAKKHPQYMGPF
jgi:hypothetical protein